METDIPTNRPDNATASAINPLTVRMLSMHRMLTDEREVEFVGYSAQPCPAPLCFIGELQYFTGF